MERSWCVRLPSGTEIKFSIGSSMNDKLSGLGFARYGFYSVWLWSKNWGFEQLDFRLNLTSYVLNSFKYLRYERLFNIFINKLTNIPKHSSWIRTPAKYCISDSFPHCLKVLVRSHHSGNVASVSSHCLLPWHKCAIHWNKYLYSSVNPSSLAAR